MPSSFNFKRLTNRALIDRSDSYQLPSPHGCVFQGVMRHNVGDYAKPLTENSVVSAQENSTVEADARISGAAPISLPLHQNNADQLISAKFVMHASFRLQWGLSPEQ